jgi:hypothetical protein
MTLKLSWAAGEIIWSFQASSYAPARRAYESAGFGLLPIARYFKKL